MHKLSVFMILSLITLIFGLDSSANITGKICDDLSTGKIIVRNGDTVVSVTAPTGKFISGYCVKSGSFNQGLGPEYYRTIPIKTTFISHSSGQEIGHYSLRYVDAN